jgi:serine/threonine protein kinase
LAQPLETVIGGKYEILQKIREGGMGSIYKVRHRLLDEVRIVKVLRSNLAMDETLQQRFQNEAKIAIRLRHPNIAHLYDFSVSQEGTLAFIVMEYIDGVTLQELIAQNGAPTIGMAVEIASQFAGALAYLHSQGFVHRDIASDNLMLTTDFEGSPLVKLIDLGIAKERTEELNLTATGIFMGKVRYSPPEVFNSEGGAAALDERSDVYSFGVLLYELFTGVPPFDGDNFSEIVAGHLFRPPKPFEESDPDGRVSEELRLLTLRALEKDREKRPASAGEIAEELDKHAAGGDSHGAELAEALEATSHIATLESEASVREGSTQNRLDQQFGVGDTSSHDEENRAVRLQGVAHAAGAIQQRTELGEITSAKRDLELAVSLYGEHPEFEQLRSELETRSGAAEPPSRENLGPGQATAVTDGGTMRIGVHKTPLERLTSPPGLLLAAVVLLGAAGGIGLLLAARSPKPPVENRVGELPPAAAMFVERAPRWGTLPADEAGVLAEDLEVEVPEPSREQTSEPAATPAAQKPTPTPPPQPRPQPEPIRAQPVDPEPQPVVEPTEAPRGELYGPDPGVIPPSLVNLPPVVYPTGFKAPKDRIFVMVDVLVGEDGRVITSKIAPREGAKKRFKEIAVEAAKQATFRPATKVGVVGKMWTTIRVPLPGE